MASQPQTLVIFGASGDLTARKLIPSLYNLDLKKRLPANLQIAGVSRRPMTDDAFRQHLAPRAKEFVKGHFSEASWNDFARRVHYVACDAGNAEGMSVLKRWLDQAEQG